jgi:hypothetical protein
MPHTFVAGEVLTAVNMELLPKGRMGSASVTADQGSITTVVDLTSLSVTFTAISAHYYLILGKCLAQSTVATDQVQLVIADGSSTQINADADNASVANQSFGLGAMALVTGASGSTTYKLRMLRGAGSGTVTMKASATVPAFIVVQDLGA